VVLGIDNGPVQPYAFYPGSTTKLKKLFGKNSQVGTNLGTIFLSYNLYRFRTIWTFERSKKASELQKRGTKTPENQNSQVGTNMGKRKLVNRNNQFVTFTLKT
jgi:hypothetical protein